MIVVDLGCASHDGDSSIPYLVDRFKPEVLWGFDPLVEDREYRLGTTDVILSGKAAWTHEGFLDLGIGAPSLLDATVEIDKRDHGEWKKSRTVPCFNFPWWLMEQITPEMYRQVVVKMNVEGAEFTLLPNMDNGLLGLLIVMWHDKRMGKDYRERRKVLERDYITCPLEEWTVEMAQA